MKIGAMQVEPAWSASGVQGFFEHDKYWYHKVYAVCFGMWFLFHTFVSKTSTLRKRAGNMPLGRDGISPKEWVPRCIVVKWFKRAVLNAVGLSGPGLARLLARNLWQKRRKDFFISLMSVAASEEERRDEIQESVIAILAHRSEFKARVGIQLNVSCPNVGASYLNIAMEAWNLLNVFLKEDPEGFFTVVVKLGPNTKPLDIMCIAAHPRCDGLCLSNTLPYGELPDAVDWKRYFGSADPKESPLAKRGFPPGGFSGKALLAINCKLVREVRKLGVKKHINFCGGVLGPVSALKALRSGADSISIGTAAILAPWGVLPAIIMAHVVAWFRFNFLKGATHVQ